MILDHVGIPVADLRRSKAFFQSALAPLTAESRAQVDAFHRAGLAAGGKDNGAPGIRVHYHPDYYGAFILDLDRHNVEVVCHRPE